MKKDDKGFTLIELLAVIVILAALSAIVMSIFGNKGEEARVASHATNVSELGKLSQTYQWHKEEASIDKTNYYNELTADHPLVKDGTLKDKMENPWK